MEIFFLNCPIIHETKFGICINFYNQFSNLSKNTAINFQFSLLKTSHRYLSSLSIVFIYDNFFVILLFYIYTIHYFKNFRYLVIAKKTKRTTDYIAIEYY